MTDPPTRSSHARSGAGAGSLLNLLGLLGLLGTGRVTDPVYVQCPAFFQDPVFREPTAEERNLAGRTGEPFPVLVAFDSEGGAASVSGLIAAGGLRIVRGTVFRYWREVLEPGRRRAPWLAPPATAAL